MQDSYNLVQLADNNDWSVWKGIVENNHQVHMTCNECNPDLEKSSTFYLSKKLLHNATSYHKVRVAQKFDILHQRQVKVKFKVASVAMPQK